MTKLYYVEGYSEENMAKAILRNDGVSFSDDASAILKNEISYLKNCESDSGIFPSLEEDAYLIKQVRNKTIIIFRDIDKSICYSTYKSEVQAFLVANNLYNNFRIINSRPEIEFHYTESVEILKSVIMSYINKRKGTQNTSYTTIDPQGLLNPNDYHSIKQVLKRNGVSFSKKDFSDRYFNTIIAREKTISIIDRFRSVM